MSAAIASPCCHAANFVATWHISLLRFRRNTCGPPSPCLQSQALPPHGKREIGGYAGPEPTRYTDWEIKGRCSDF